jgi:hypothetical protein
MTEAEWSASLGRPLVSVLIDTYNYGRYVEQAIESVLGQEFAGPVEVLVVDDGSEDDTAERVRKFGERVRYLRKANGGQASAFNLGLREARGQIVALLDGDDYWLPGKLRRVVEEFARNPEAGMVYHRLREVDERNGGEKDGDFAAISGWVTAGRNKLMSYILYPTSALAFRRKWLEELGPIPETLRIQADAYWSGLVIFVAPVAAIEQSLGVYRIHGRNLFHAQGCAQAAGGAARRIQTRGALLAGMRSWLRARGHATERGDVAEYLRQWSLAQEEDQFAMEAPGRWRFFGHLWRSAGCLGPRRGWRHRMVSYANAVGGLVVGYQSFYLLDAWRVKLMRFLRRGAARTAASAPASAVRPLDRTAP